MAALSHGVCDKLWVLDAPEIKSRRGDMLVNAAEPDAYDYLRMSAYLIKHPRGLILFDTGIPPECADDPASVYGGILAGLDMRFSPEQRIDNQIKALGFKLSDVTHVIASHAHIDHIGGVHLFPQAKLIIGEGELNYALWPDPQFVWMFQRELLENLVNRPLTVVPRRDLDLFGDGSVVILWTPGHTVGELCCLVRLASTQVILTGDTTHLREGLERELPFPNDYDTVNARRSIRRLNQIAEATQADIWVAHDPSDFDRLKKQPHAYE
jgi:N-acyl homoserine lactone hydrolase